MSVVEAVLAVARKRTSQTTSDAACLWWRRVEEVMRVNLRSAQVAAQRCLAPAVDRQYLQGIRAVDDLEAEFDDALAVRPREICYLEGDNFAYLMSSHRNANFDIHAVPARTLAARRPTPQR